MVFWEFEVNGGRYIPRKKVKIVSYKLISMAFPLWKTGLLPKNGFHRILMAFIMQEWRKKYELHLISWLDGTVHETTS